MLELFCISFFSLIGFFVVVQTFFKILYFFYRVFLRKRLDLVERYGKGTWVVITGGSAGSGRAYAEEFANMGFNLILLARTKTRLEQVAQELKSKFTDINVECIAFDFDSANREKIGELYKTFDSLDVSIFVSNVGKFALGKHHLFDEELIEKIVNVNVVTPSILTKYFTTKFMNRYNKSAMIFTTSCEAATLPWKYLAMHTGTKSFIDFLARSLHHQYSDKIDVVVIRPLVFETEFIKAKGNFSRHYSTVPASEVAKSAIDSLGYENHTFGGFWHTMCSNFMHHHLSTLIPEKELENKIIQRA